MAKVATVVSPAIILAAVEELDVRRRTYLLGLAGSLLGGALALELHTRGPSVSDRPLAAYDCPPFEGGEEWTPTVCSHTVDPEAAEIHLQPSPERTADPEELTLTLTNDSDRTLRIDPWNWRLRTHGEQGWRAIEYTGGIASSGGAASGSVEVPPGETHEWNAMELAEHFAGWNFDFPPSTYLLGVGVSDPDAEERVRYAALFRITS